ncbi:outer membrane beta-barrel protein [Sulfurisoma sediminicola]|uniref:Opacity protein-like surface antigen n=1 Tax=Sulfurisoma sediminicola TaxID=1381557 RepID=A0A497XJ32_9PROT|nr:outer membrane beta-barrel protein [Sulfurisoma sediminicola]RLJ67942.1 opacity protein-like surface antigen [Sulfurisoma sediminicola]
MKKTIAVLTLAVASSFTYAQGVSSKPIVGPWYIGVSGGQSRADLDNWDYYDGYYFVDATTGATIPYTGLVTLNSDTRHTAWRVYAGYNFNENWAIEGAYTDLGQIKAEYVMNSTGLPRFEITGDQVSWSGAIKGTLPINKQFDVFGLVGATSNRTKVNFMQITSRFASVPSGSDHRTDLLTGLGAEFKPSPNIGIRLEYQNYNQFGGSGQDVNDALRMTVDAWTLGAAVKF